MVADGPSRNLIRDISGEAAEEQTYILEGYSGGPGKTHAALFSHQHIFATNVGIPYPPEGAPCWCKYIFYLFLLALHIHYTGIIKKKFKGGCHFQKYEWQLFWGGGEQDQEDKDDFSEKRFVFEFFNKLNNNVHTSLYSFFH